MNSFTLTAVGHLARNPETVARSDVIYTRFCLIGNDYAGKDDEGIAREVVTSVWFVAFGAAGEIIARHSHKGDQLIVEARVRANNWTDKQGEKQYDLAFVVQGFKFGAPGKSKREELDGRREQTLSLPRGANRGNGRERDRNYAVSGPGDESRDRKPGDASDSDLADLPDTESVEGSERPAPEDPDGLEPESAAAADPVSALRADPGATTVTDTPSGPVAPIPAYPVATTVADMSVGSVAALPAGPGPNIVADAPADPVAAVAADPVGTPDAVTPAGRIATPGPAMSPDPPAAATTVPANPVVTAGAASRAKAVHDKGRGSRSSRKAATAAV